MELLWPDMTTAPPSTATSPGSARRFRHASGIAPLGRDNPVNFSRPHPCEAAQFTKSLLSESRHRRTYDFGCSAAGGLLRHESKRTTSAADVMPNNRCERGRVQIQLSLVRS